MKLLNSVDIFCNMFYVLQHFCYNIFPELINDGNEFKVLLSE